MSKIIKPLWSNILLSQQNEKQVASTTGSVRLYSAFLILSFLKETFHCNFTLKHNNSLLSITGYTFSILCRLSALPGYAAPAFRWNGHIKRKQRQETKFTQTLLWHKPKPKLVSARSSVIPSLKLWSPQQWGGDRISALWLALASCKQLALKTTFSHLTAHSTEALQVQQTVYLTTKNKAKETFCFIFQTRWLLPIRGFKEKTTKS